MIFKFWEKQNQLSTKKTLLKDLINSLDILDTDKTLFLEAMIIASPERIEILYSEMVHFIKESELKEIDEIEKTHFSSIDGMTIKQANEKKKDINSFNFLLTNV
jgi:hypothetical protein